MTKKISLGTRWGFDRVEGALGVVYAVDVQTHLVGSKSRSRAFRVAPHPRESGWTVDRLPWLGPWECYVDGPFPTPQEAAKALVEDIGDW